MAIAIRQYVSSQDDALDKVVREPIVAQPGRVAWDMNDATGAKLAAGPTSPALPAASASRPASWSD